MITFQLDIGGPLSPASSGPQTNEIEVLDALRPEAASVIVFEDEGEVNRQLLLRKLGSLVPEKEARGVPPDGNEPVTVIEACPSCEIALGATRRDEGEKSNTVTRWGNEMLKTGLLLPWPTTKCSTHA